MGVVTPGLVITKIDIVRIVIFLKLYPQTSIGDILDSVMLRSLVLKHHSSMQGSGPVFTKILILRIVLFLKFFLEFCSFLRIILRIRIFKIWNVLKSSQFGPILREI